MRTSRFFERRCRGHGHWMIAFTKSLRRAARALERDKMIFHPKNLHHILVAGAVAVTVAVVLSYLAPAPKALHFAVRQNLLVLYPASPIPQDANHSYLILMDQDTGRIWAYKDLTSKPILMGTMRIGEAMQQ